MFGTVSSEREVKVPGSEAWKLYSTLELAKIVAEALPSLISKINVVQGDGGAGTILELFFPLSLSLSLSTYDKSRRQIQIISAQSKSNVPKKHN
ncbi:hypothetical protein ABFX02_06G092400 [Erythranthe guttata]